MPPTDKTFNALVRKVREVWAATDEESAAWLMRELEALIERYRREQDGA